MIVKVCPCHVRIFVCSAIRQNEFFEKVKIVRIFIVFFVPYIQRLLDIVYQKESG